MTQDKAVHVGIRIIGRSLREIMEASYTEGATGLLGVVHASSDVLLDALVFYRVSSLKEIGYRVYT